MGRRWTAEDIANLKKLASTTTAVYSPRKRAEIPDRSVNLFGEEMTAESNVIQTTRLGPNQNLPALGAKPHESSASGGYLGNAFKGSKASMRRAIGTTDTRRSEPRAPPACSAKS